MSHNANMLPLLSYEQQHHVTYRQEAAAPRHSMQKRLDENFPSIYVLIHSVFLILIGLTAILLHIVLITNKGPYYYIGHGIWGGSVCILLAVICLLLIRKRLYSLYILSLVSHLLAVVVLFGAFVVINCYAVLEYSRPRTLNNSHQSPQESVLELNISMLVTGVVATIVSLAYVIIIFLRMRR